MQFRLDYQQQMDGSRLRMMAEPTLRPTPPAPPLGRDYVRLNGLFREDAAARQPVQQQQQQVGWRPGQRRTICPTNGRTDGRSGTTSYYVFKAA